MINQFLKDKDITVISSLLSKGNDSLRTFVSLFILVRYFGIEKVNEYASPERILEINKLLNGENTVISDLLKDLQWDMEIPHLVDLDLKRIFLLIEETIHSKKISEDIILYPLFNFLIIELLSNSEESIDYGRIKQFESNLKMFPLSSVDSLLFLMDDKHELFVEQLILTFLNFGFSEVKIVSYDSNIVNEDHYNNLNSFLLNKNREDLSQKLGFIANPELNHRYLSSVIEDMEENSLLLVIGIQKFLVPNKSKSKTTTFQDKKININTPDNYNWAEFTKFLDQVFIHSQQKEVNTTLFYSIAYDSNPQNLICEAAKNIDSFDIYTVNLVGLNEIPAIYQLLNDYIDGNLDENIFINELNKVKDILGNNNYYFLYGLKLLINNDYINAEKYFNLVMDSIPGFNKKLIADFYINKNQFQKAYEILEILYEEDKYMLNLIPSILRAVTYLDNVELKKIWLDKALEVNSMDPITIQYCADFYTRINMYPESAKYWRVLYELTNDIQFKLLYSINIILSEIKNYSVSKIENELLEYVHTNPQITNEVYYRLGLILAIDKKNDVEAMKYFIKIDRGFKNPHAYDSALQRIKILQKKLLEQKHLKNPNILTEFVVELINNVGIITFTNENNYRWNSIIEDTLPLEVWKKQLLNVIFEYTEKWANLDDNYLSNTNFSFDFDEKMFEGTVEVQGRNYLPVEDLCKHLLYMFSVINDFIDQGKFQEANNIIFTVFRMSSTQKNEKEQKLCIVIGLIAWSCSTYKIGDEVQSLVAAIAAIELGIECGELAVPFSFGFDNIMNIMYDNSELISKEQIKCSSLIKLLDNLGEIKHLYKYYFIAGEYDRVTNSKTEYLRSLERIWVEIPDLEVVLNVNDEDINSFVDDVRILIDSYYYNGETEKALLLIRKLTNSFILNTANKITLSFRIYFEWAQILTEEKDFYLATYLIRQSIIHIEEIRKVSFKRERAFIGEQAYKIYKLFLKILTRELYETKKKLSDSSIDIGNCLCNIVPRSIIEQKLFNQTEKISEEKWGELEKATQEYDDIFYTLQTIKRELRHTEEYQQLIEKHLECKSYLEKNHPYFKPLPMYNNISEKVSKDNFKWLKDTIQNKDIVFQLSQIDNTLVYNIVTKSDDEIVIVEIDHSVYEELLVEFNNHIHLSDSELIQVKNINAFIEICESLSNMLVEPLYKYIDQNRYNNIFFIPDLSLKYLNLNYMRYNDKWFIEYFRSIENVLDYSLVGKRKNKLHSQKIIANFANPQDNTVSKIYNMIKNNPLIEIQSMDNTQVYINEDIKTYIIVGHGISDLNGYDYLGAKVIKKSNKQMINLSHYLQVNGRIKNAMVISCSSGTPIDDYIERNNGLWSALFEKNIDYILFCKWDVSIKYTSDILEAVLKLLNENAEMSLSTALVQSQRNCSSLHPALWAGLEVWKN